MIVAMVTGVYVPGAFIFKASERGSIVAVKNARMLLR
jgi:hypothetical protein